MNREIACVPGKSLHTFPDAKNLLPCGHPVECVLRDYEEDVCYICLLEQNARLKGQKQNDLRHRRRSQ